MNTTASLDAQNVSLSQNDSLANKTRTKTCTNGERYVCDLVRISYMQGGTKVKAILFTSHRDKTLTESHCSVYGCGLKHSGRALLKAIEALKPEFVCYFDSKNTSVAFLTKQSTLSLIVWFSCCSFMILLGTIPIIIAICSKIETPWQSYFQYCTKRYTSRHEKWIEAIKNGDIFILRWSMSQKHINEELIEIMDKEGHNWKAVPLARAAFAGQSHMAEYLLTRGAFTDYVDSHKLTPLHYACLGAQVSTLKLLVAEGANIDATNGLRRTPLMLSLMLHITVPDTTQYLIEAGADVSKEDVNQCTALHYACFKGDLNMVHLIIKAGGISNNSVYLTKETFLFQLANSPIGTDCGFKTDLYTNTWTPLTSLLYRNSKEACVLLVSAGYKLKEDSILRRVLYSDADEEMNRFIKQQMREVASLLRKCRIWIRGYLGPRCLQQKISRLKLAEPLKDYLRLEIID